MLYLANVFDEGGLELPHGCFYGVSFSSGNMADDFDHDIDRIGYHRDAKDPSGLEKSAGTLGVGMVQNW